MKPAILILVLIVLMTGCTQLPPVRPIDKVFFAFGREDKSDQEFRIPEDRSITEYRCRVGVNCSTEEFPRLLGLPGSGYVTERIIISFRLDQAYDNVILRMARGGAETTAVTVDGKQTYLVTNEMLGSWEHFVVGVYNLELGTLKEGVHTIELSVANDGKGSGGYQWDALSLLIK